jgi:adenylate kinase
VKALYIFIGPPGSGKGTLSHLCTQRLGWVQLSTGDLCRKNISEQTEIGKEIDFIIKSGKLISDELMTRMVFDWLKTFANRAFPAMILDGYPRTLMQAHELNSIISKQFSNVAVCVVRFLISQDAVINRLSGRYICQNEKCKAVYSVLKGSALGTKMPMVCDMCAHILVRRPDDESESVLERLRIYSAHEQMLIDFYKNSKSCLIEFDVEKPSEEVFKSFKKLIGVSDSL